MTSLTITKPLTAADLDKKVEDYVRQLATETDAVRASAEYRTYLDCMAKFWRYSLHNQLLIHIQRPRASRVAGFRTWNQLGRRVNAGEKAIKILAPFIKHVVKKDERTGEEKEFDLTYFCPVSVFDVSQTDGQDLPKLDIDLTGNSHEWLITRLVEFCKKHQIEVEFKELGVNGLYGYSQGGKIAVAANQSPNMQVNTLIHEIAHELLHKGEDGQKFTKQEREIQAESVAYVVCQSLGLEAKSPLYLVSYRAESGKIIENMGVVSQTVREILSTLEPVHLLQWGHGLSTMETSSVFA